MMQHRPFELAVDVNADDHVLGPERAPATIVEYGDFECPYCKQAAPAVKLLLEHFDGRVRFAYRHFPIEEAHPHARRAAEAAECAGAQGKFWEMHDLLFVNQLRLQEHYLQGYARDLGLDLERFASDMRDAVYLPRVREHQLGARESGVRSTPGFFINRRLHDVSFTLQSLEQAIEAALAGQAPR